MTRAANASIIITTAMTPTHRLPIANPEKGIKYEEYVHSKTTYNNQGMVDEKKRGPTFLICR